MADDASDPFAKFGDAVAPPTLTTSDGLAPPTLTASDGLAPQTAPADPDDPFAKFGAAIAPPVSASGAFARGAERGVLPAAGGVVAAGTGAEVGAELGLLGGPFSELTVPAGALIGGVVGGFGGSFAVQKAQDYALSAAPPTWTEAIGQDDRQQRLDQEQHPYASFLGGLAPYVLTMRPGATPGLAENATALQRIIANPVTARVFSGGVMGGMELGQEATSGQPVDWTKVAISTGAGVVLNRPTRLGETIEGLGAAPARAVFGRMATARAVPAPETTPQPPEPTLAQAADLKVMGPGVTEDVFQGELQQDPDAERAAQQTAADEQSAIGAPPEPDVDAIARRHEPELFAQYDALTAQRDAFRNRIAELSNPPPEAVDALDEQRKTLEGQLPSPLGFQNGSEARRLRAQIAMIDAQKQELVARQQAFASGQNEETPEIAQMRKHFQDVDYQLRDVGRDVAAARRRAADMIGSGFVEPEPAAESAPVNTEASPVNQAPEAAPVNAEAAPVNAEAIPAPLPVIAEDVRQKLIDAGRPTYEAEAAGQLTQALYETHAARLGNKPGNSAQEIYQREAPGVAINERLKKAYGRLTPDNVIQLARDAHAGTYVHEIGHDWLNRMLRDADSPDAVDSLKSDAQTVKQWAKFDPEKPVEGQTRAHEKFARGFEQYLREGVAPSPQLASVFGKFRGWLTQIYQTLKGLGAPINDDIRGVFDRMLATEPQRTVVAPERPAAQTMDEIHAADAAQVEPAQAAAAADRVEAERTQEPPQEIAHELAPTVAEVEAERAAAGPAGAADAAGENGGGRVGLREVVGGGGEAGSESGGGGVGAERGAQRQGGNGPAAESGGLPAVGRPGGPKSRPLAPTPADILNPVDDRFVDAAGNIRVENLTSIPELVQAIHDSADRNDDFRSVRGAMTRGQMSDLADDMGLDAADVKEQDLARLLGGTRDLAPKILAARRLVVDSAGVVSEAMARAADTDDPQALANFAQAIGRHDMIQSALAGVTAEWGRAGNAFHSLVTGWDRAQNIGQFLRENTGRDLYQLKAMAKLGKNLNSPGKVSKFLRDAGKRSGGRMLLEYWVNSLISGIATHATYVIGNTALMLNKIGPETLIASALGAGREGDRVYAGEVGAGLRELARAYPKAVQAALEALKTGQTTLLPGEAAHPLTPFEGDTVLRLARTIGNEDVGWREMQADAFGLLRGMRDGVLATGALLKSGAPGAPLVSARYSPLGQIPDVAIRGAVLPVGSLVRLPSRNVAAIHSFQRVMNYSIEKNAKAWRQATQEGLEGEAHAARTAWLRQNPSEESMADFRESANQLTLMGASGELVNRISRVTNWAPKLPLLGETPLFKFVDPFVKIAANIMSQSVMLRTPFGLLAPEIRADVMGRNGPVAQDMARARMIVGSALAITFGGLAAEGVVTGSGPSDPRQAAVWRLAGNQPYSVRIGDIWYDTHRLGPIGMLTGLAADMYDVAHAATSGDMLQAGSAFMHAIVQNMLDESFMRGPAELIQAIEDPQRYGQRYIEDLASSFVPFSVGLSQIDRSTDPYSRQARTIMDSVRQKIPGLSESLFPRRDVWGEPMPNRATVASGLTAIYESRVSRDPVNLALMQLGMGVAPVPRTIRNVRLSDQQYDDFARLAGRMSKQRLDTIIRSPDWRMWPPHAQRDVIQEVVKQSREAARGVMFMKYPQIIAQATRQKMAKQAN